MENNFLIEFKINGRSKNIFLIEKLAPDKFCNAISFNH